jgi:hypothetical protein
MTKPTFMKHVFKMYAFYADIRAALDGLCFVVGSAFYNKEELTELSSVDWITRVPMLAKESKAYHNKAREEYPWHATSDARYQIAEIEHHPIETIVANQI